MLLGRNANLGQSDGGSDAGAGAPKPEPLTQEQQNVALRQELKTTREYLQSVIEELRSATHGAGAFKRTFASYEPMA